jgi:hypothetical protein
VQSRSTHRLIHRSRENGLRFYFGLAEYPATFTREADEAAALGRCGSDDSEHCDGEPKEPTQPGNAKKRGVGMPTPPVLAYYGVALLAYTALDAGRACS